MTHMSDQDLPKERMSPYQRWELPSFDGPGMGGKAASASRSTAGLPTAAQLEQLHQQAHEEGFRTGYAEGVQKALQEGARIAEVMASLEKQMKLVDQEVLQALMELSLEVARQMVRKTLQVKPEWLLDVVREAVRHLPHFSHAAHLMVHPEDAILVREAMGEQLAHTGWKIIEDVQMERGGCRVETAHSQIDASLSKRWQHIVTSIGLEREWLQT